MDNTNFDFYVKRAIKNTVIDFSKKEKREEVFHALNIDDALLFNNDNGAFLDSSDVLDSFYIENINLVKALKRLNEAEKILLELAVIKGYKDREVAILTSTKENTITRRKTEH